MIKNVKYLLTTHLINEMPQDNVPEYVIVGKSNVGKSTFINAITNRKRLAHTSSTPGKTRAISLYDVNNSEYRIVDIPGYGYAKVSNLQKDMFAKMIDSYLSSRTNIFKIVLLIDSRRGITSDDRDMINYFIFNKMSFVIVGTKLDKVNQSEQTKFIRNINQELNIMPIMYSALTKRGIENVYLIFNHD